MTTIDNRKLFLFQRLVHFRDENQENRDIQSIDLVIRDHYNLRTKIKKTGRDSCSGSQKFLLHSSLSGLGYHHFPLLKKNTSMNKVKNFFVFIQICDPNSSYPKKFKK